jgi:hypothetical protein
MGCAQPSDIGAGVSDIFSGFGDLSKMPVLPPNDIGC